MSQSAKLHSPLFAKNPRTSAFFETTILRLLFALQFWIVLTLFANRGAAGMVGIMIYVFLINIWYAWMRYRLSTAQALLETIGMLPLAALHLGVALLLDWRQSDLAVGHSVVWLLRAFLFGLYYLSARWLTLGLRQSNSWDQRLLRPVLRLPLVRRLSLLSVDNWVPQSLP